MNDPVTLAAACLVLAAGTFAFRIAGPIVRSRLTLPDRLEQTMDAAAVVLLVAVVATSALTDGHAVAGLARPLGVLVGGVLAWRRAPFPVVVLVAAGTTAGLRLLGVS